MSDPGTAQAVHRPHAASVSMARSRCWCCRPQPAAVPDRVRPRARRRARRHGPRLSRGRAADHAAVRADGCRRRGRRRAARRVGEQRALSVALALIAAGCTARLWSDGSAGLIGTAIVAGAGVAVIQALVPGLAKRWFVDRLPLAMASTRPRWSARRVRRGRRPVARRAGRLASRARRVCCPLVTLALAKRRRATPCTRRP